MSFQIECPECGCRPVGEFHFGGAVRERPEPAAGDHVWAEYVYTRPNIAGVQREWWFHRAACKQWFIASRDTRSNVMQPAQAPDSQEARG